MSRAATTRMPGMSRWLQPADDRRRQRQDRRCAQRARDQGLRRRLRRDSRRIGAGDRWRRSRRRPGAADVAIDQEPPLPQIADQGRPRGRGALRHQRRRHRRPHRGRASAAGRSGSCSSESAATTLPCASCRASASSPEAIGDLILTAPGGARIPLVAGRPTITLQVRREHDHAGDEPPPPHGEAQPPRTATCRPFWRRPQSSHRRQRAATTRATTEIVWGGQFENQQRAQSAPGAHPRPSCWRSCSCCSTARSATLRHAAAHPHQRAAGGAGRHGRAASARR